MEQLKFQVKMKVKDMYRFLLYHTYSHVSGWFGVVLSLIAIYMLVTQYDTLDDMGKMILFVIGLLFTVVNPLMLLSKAQQQIAGNPVYRKPLCYMLDDTGIQISQDDQEQSMSWEQVIAVKRFWGEVMVYTSKKHAFVFPVSQMGEDASRIIDYIEEHSAHLKNSSDKRENI